MPSVVPGIFPAGKVIYTLHPHASAKRKNHFNVLVPPEPRLR